ncbi:MAG TPA: hypothetical protein VJT31_04720 [Rugosimonospora sp.]|nr:hypothetical protein [Rugosimonospora sp.]
MTLLGALVAPLGGTAAVADDTTVALPYQSAGWSFRQVAHGDLPGFEDPSFDASAWPLGQAGMGTVNGVCPWNNTGQVHTAWDLDTDMLIRHHVTIPAGGSRVHIAGTIDNNADVYVNGTLVQHVENGDCQSDGINVDVPAGALGVDNLIAIRASDYGSADFVDVQVTYVPPPPLLLRAGEFTAVLGTSPMPRKAVAIDGRCTAGFAVLRGTDRYLLTADRCRNWLDKNGHAVGQASIVDIEGPTPPAIAPGPQPSWVHYATGLDCTGSGPGCLHQPEGGKAHDVLAWRPDAGGVIPTGALQTDHGVYPVLASADWYPGERICQVGAATGGERCGTILAKSAYDKQSGYVRWRYADATQHVLDGDSGGPVYAYVYHPDGSIEGVAALGINEAYTCTKRATVCTNGFLPIATVTQELGVVVLDSP